MKTFARGSSEWTTPAATKRKTTYWTVVKTPAPGTINAKKINTRLDIARFKPGKHGGGSFFITAVNGDIDTNPKPDLFVRGTRYTGHNASTGVNSNSPLGLPGNGALRKPGCVISQTIKAYITNQGTENAPDVQVSLKASFPITDSEGKTVKYRIHQEQNIPDGIRKGETKLIKFIIGDMIPLSKNAYMSAKITVDPKNNVAEAMEANNVYTVPDIYFACKEKEIRVPDISDIPIGPDGIPDDLPL